MSIEAKSTAIVDPSILALLEAERSKALSPREWKFRLGGYGYAIREDGDAQVVTCLRQGIDIGMMPQRQN